MNKNNNSSNKMEIEDYFEKLLFNYGYNISRSDSKHNDAWEKSYKKFCRDDYGVKFIIRCYYKKHLLSNTPNNEEYIFEVTFKLPNFSEFVACTHQWNFNEENRIANNYYTLAEVEEFFLKIWISMECRYWEKD